MGFYRKKPVVIEAFRHVGGTVRLVDLPSWLFHAIIDDKIVSVQPDRSLLITTLEGDMTAQLGDWIIRGVKGELYPCKNDIFEATYEAANDDMTLITDEFNPEKD